MPKGKAVICTNLQLDEQYFKSANAAANAEKCILEHYKDKAYKGVALLKDGNTELFSSDVGGYDGSES